MCNQDPRQTSKNPSLFNSHLRSPTVCICLSLCGLSFGCTMCVCVRGWCIFCYLGMCVSIANSVFLSFMPLLCRVKALFHGNRHDHDHFSSHHDHFPNRKKLRVVKPVLPVCYYFVWTFYHTWDIWGITFHPDSKFSCREQETVWIIRTLRENTACSPTCPKN